MKCKLCGDAEREVRYMCRPCYNAYMRDWYAKKRQNPEFIAKDNLRKNKWFHENHDKGLYTARKRRLKNKKILFEHYGGACECCGEDRFEFLTLDHFNEDGSTHRKEIGKSTQHLYKWAIANDFPPALRVLCYNCHWSITFNKFCPHSNLTAHKELMSLIH